MYLANVSTEPFFAVASKNKPKLDAAESPAEGKLPIAILND